MYIMADLPAINSPGFPGSLQVFHLLVSRLDHQISQEIPTVANFHFFFINFVNFEMSKRRIKQELYEPSLMALAPTSLL